MEPPVKANVLYVEDDPTLGFITRENLEREGYVVTLISDGREAWDRFQAEKFDICILDVMLPGLDGFTLARKIREINKNIPILFLTAKTLQEDRIEGLLTGADDYVVKPFSIRELELRMRIFLRRAGFSRIDNVLGLKPIRIGSFVLDFDNLVLKHESGSESTLTMREAELLKFFFENAGRVVEREEILRSVWGENNYFFGRSLDVFISRLRKYMKADQDIKIENRHGIGFVFRIQ